MSSGIFAEPTVPVDVLKTLDGILISASPQKEEKVDMLPSSADSDSSSQTMEELPPSAMISKGAKDLSESTSEQTKDSKTCDILVIGDEMSIDSSSNASTQNHFEEMDSLTEEETSDICDNELLRRYAEPRC